MRKSKSLHLILRGAGWCCITIVVLIGIFILLKSYPFIQQMGLSVLWQDERWAPTQGLFNLVPIFVGSILVTMGAVLVAGPIGVLLAIFGRFYAPVWVAKVYRGLIELLAGIPSVVYGFWGLVVLVPLINNIAAPGASLLAGVIVLAVMILPIVVLAADTAFEQVPEKWMVAADALALQTWSKVYVIALVWAGVTVFLPLINDDFNINVDVYITAFQRFVFVVVLMLPFEIRDLKFDNLKLATIPQKIGVKYTKGIGLVLLIFFFFAEFFKNELTHGNISKTLLIALITFCFLVFSNKKRNRYYSSFWVESIPIFWLLITLFC